MTRAATHDEIADHDRDNRKHEPRPFDHLNPPTADSIEIAILVRAVKSPFDGAKLIEQYAQTVAAGARLEGVEQAYGRMTAILDREAV